MRPRGAEFRDHARRALAAHRDPNNIAHAVAPRLTSMVPDTAVRLDDRGSTA